METSRTARMPNAVQRKAAKSQLVDVVESPLLYSTPTSRATSLSRSSSASDRSAFNVSSTSTSPTHESGDSMDNTTMRSGGLSSQISQQPTSPLPLAIPGGASWLKDVRREQNSALPGGTQELTAARFLALEQLSNSDEDQQELQKVDIGSVFTSRVFPYIRSFLSNARHSPLASLVPPKPLLAGDGHACFIFLYDDRCPTYLSDEIQWKKTKMSVKHIVFNEKKGTYKLKNHKTDEGEPVLRRQTWQGSGPHASWRRHEYKLIADDIIYRPDGKGKLAMYTRQVLHQFPVLLHYFHTGLPAGILSSGSISTRSAAKSTGAKKKRSREDDDETNDETYVDPSDRGQRTRTRAKQQELLGGSDEATAAALLMLSSAAVKY